MPATGDHYRFALGERIRRIAEQTAGVSNRRLTRSVGGRIANRHVPLRIHRKTGHPPPQAIGAIIESLLLRCVGRNAATRHIELIPANRDRAGATLVIVDAVRNP